jgi:PAS domain S-box-containing protein
MSATAGMHSVPERSSADVLGRIDDAVFALDAEWRLTALNDRAASLIGRAPGEVLGERLWEAVAGIESGPVGDGLRRAVDTGETVRFEVREDSPERWFEVRAYPSANGLTACVCDITDRKQSAADRKAQREAFAEGPVVAFKWRNEEGWPVEYVSESVAEAFGYSPERLESEPVQYADLIHRDDLEQVVAEFDRRAEATADAFSPAPFRIEAGSGELRWVRASVTPVRADGEITHYLGYLLDVTEKRRLEAALRESERSLRELTDIASDAERSFEAKLSALLELGTERLGLPYGFLNRSGRSRYHVEGAVGDHPRLQPGNSAPESAAYCRKTMQQEGTLAIQDAAAAGWTDDPAYERFELGSYIGGTVVVGGDEYGTLCFAADAGRDRAFDDAERAFVELLVQWIGNELASEAFETKLREMNATAQQLIAAGSREEIAALTTETVSSVLDLPVGVIWWHDEPADALVPAWTTEAAAAVDAQPALENGDSARYDAFAAGELRVHDEPGVGTPGGETTTTNSEVLVPLGGHGLLSVGSTENRAFSEAELNLLEVLASTVAAALSRAEHERQLQATRQDLERSNEELEQFAYAASHDLQEPLRTVSGYLTLLERRYGADLDDDAVEFLDFAVDGADRMREMIQALLAYSRVDTSDERFEAVAVSTVFDRVVRDLDVRIDETDGAVSTPETELTIPGDRSQLVRLFRNLVENGLTYSAAPRTVDVSVTHNDGRVQFRVADNGIGMELDGTGEIFEVFNRLHTREEFEGTGIGLSISRKIAERHGGSISVASEPGEGSTFTVELPAGDGTDR